jgi:uncharacterized radical SAM protein YgiQ
MKDFLPISLEEARSQGIDEFDFILISGDAYVDHPSFGSALIGRLLEGAGYNVGIIPQPDMSDPESIAVLGRPRLAFLLSSGNMDSMVAHYTANKKPRSQDFYSPGGKAGFRPDRALIAYANAVRQKFKKVFLIGGGIEASLRRLSHWDYWPEKFRKSILLDAKLDLIVYGMAEKALLEVAEVLAHGGGIEELKNIRGIVYAGSKKIDEAEAKKLGLRLSYLPSFDSFKEDKKLFAKSTALRMKENDFYSAGILVEPCDTRFVVQNPPSPPLSQEEMDAVYDLPFTRKAHPVYEKSGGIPALKEVAFSITSSRGCFGSCSFCSLAFHTGRIIQSRSKESLLKEAKILTEDPDFKGYIHDLGGPTANFYHKACEKQEAGKGACLGKECLWPSPCSEINPSHTEYLAVLKAIRSLPKVKKVFIRSGIRFDYLLLEKDETFLQELCEHHLSGQLKLAPEHVSPHVLEAMSKPAPEVYEEFKKRFTKMNKKLDKKQYIIPYFISAHPGSRLEDALELALYLAKEGFVPDQVQDFYPTPGSLSTCMYATGIDPRTMEEIYIPNTVKERKLQRALLQFNKKENTALVREALKILGREDLVSVLRPYYRKKK